MLPEPCKRCPESICQGGEECPFLLSQTEEAVKPKRRRTNSSKKNIRVPEDVQSLFHSLGMIIPNEAQLVITISPQKKDNSTIILITTSGKVLLKKEVSRLIKRPVTLKYRKGSLISSSV
jgi:hypothetical protein